METEVRKGPDRARPPYFPNGATDSIRLVAYSLTLRPEIAEERRS